MKKNILLSMLFVLGISVSAFAQDVKKETFKVYGNCGMCETRIEKAAKSVEGVSAADWDKETKMIEVSFKSDVATVDKVKLALAKVGHDTDAHKSSDEVYEKLPGCCKYERPEK